MEWITAVLTTIVLIVLPIFVYWQYWRLTHKKILLLADQLPGPTPLPIIGNALVVMAQPEEQLNRIAELMHEYGEYVRVWLGPDLNIIVKNPADIKLLLSSNKLNRKGPLYDCMKDYIGPGILTGGPTWRNHRKIVTPSYSKKANKHYSKIFNEESENLAKLFLKKNPNLAFDVYYDVVKSTTQSVCQTLMGLSKEESLNVKSLDEVVLITQRFYDIIFQKMVRWWLQVPIINWAFGEYKTEKYIMKRINELTEDILKKRRRSLNDGVDEDVMSIVDRYILSAELTEQELKWETFTLFTTSQEASAKIASATILILAHLQDWQDKVYNEIIDKLGPEDGPVTDNELKDLLYLDMVYKEALRYFPIAAMFQRKVEEDITINDGKLLIPATTSIVISIHELHRDPDHWDEPLKIKPERFLPENVMKRDANAYMPFSLGPMDCLGRLYATSLIKTLVIRVLRKVQLLPVGDLENLKLHVAISVKAANGYNVICKPRVLVNGKH